MRIINSFIVLIALFLTPAAATAISLLRDSDVEHALQELARPILQAANLPSERVKILVVDDLQLNAFVIDNHHIFLNAGMVLKTNSASMLQSIIAHEAAHIANGHIARRAKTIKTARSAAGFGMALGIAAGAAGGAGAEGRYGCGALAASDLVVLSLDLVNDGDEDPEVLLFLTDGYGQAPSTRPNYPVIWGVIEGGIKPAKWGESIDINLGN